MGLNSEFTKHLLKLRASFGYLKFAIANALNSPAIIRAIEWFTDRIVILGDYLSEHPNMSLLILGVITSMLLIGKLASIASGILQFGMLMKIMGGAGAATAISNLSKLAAIGAIGISLYFEWTTFDKVINGDFSLINILKMATAATLGSYAFFTLTSEASNVVMLGGALEIGSVVLGVSVGLKFVLDAFKSLKETEKEAPGIDKVWHLLVASVSGMFGGALAGAFAGAAVGSVIPGVGTVAGAMAGALIGEIVVGAALIIKLLPQVDTVDPAKKYHDFSRLDEAGMRSELFDKNITLTNKDLNKNLNLINSYDYDNNSFSDFTSNAIDETNKLYQIIDYNVNGALKNNIGLINSTDYKNNSYSVFVDSAKKATNLLNKNIDTNTNVLLPNQKQAMQNQFSTLDTLASKINNAAAAQERYNRAAHNHSTHNSVASSSNNHSMSIAPSLSTSTQTGGVYFNSSGQGFSSAFGNPNGD